MELYRHYVDPRNIPPMVIEGTIENINPIPGKTPGTLAYIGEDVTVITNIDGKVITVIPKNN